MAALLDLQGRIEASWALQYTKDLPSLTNKTLGVSNKPGISYSVGTGDGQAAQAYSAKFTMTPSQVINLNLEDGSLLDIFTDAFALSEVKAIRISHAFLTNGSSGITVSGNWATTNFGASFSYPLKQKGVWLDIDNVGRAVTSSTGDILTLTNGDGSNSATVFVDIAGN